MRVIQLRSFAAKNPQTVESDRENFVLARARNGFMRGMGRRHYAALSPTGFAIVTGTETPIRRSPEP